MPSRVGGGLEPLAAIACGLIVTAHARIWVPIQGYVHFLWRAFCGGWRVWITILVCATLTVAVHYPGQMSLDTILQLYDGQTRTYVSNQPPAMSFLLNILTPGGMLVMNVTLYALSVAALLKGSRAVVQAKMAATLILFFYPVIALYNGILWKDVLFANLALSGFLLLPLRIGVVQRRWLVLSGALFGLGCLVRQQGILVAVIGVFAILTIPLQNRGTLGRALSLTYWGGAAFATVLFLSAAVSATAIRDQSLAGIGPLFQIAVFDLAGINAYGGGVAYPLLRQAGVDQMALQRKFANYEADRVESIAEDYGPRGPFYGIPIRVIFRQWWSAVREHPSLYLRHRIELFKWLIGLRDTTRCLPIYAGVSPEPGALVRWLGLKPGLTWRARLVTMAERHFLFLYKPIEYAIIAISLIGYLLWRRAPDKATVIWLQVAGLAYLSSYFLIGIACDFRYAYFLVVAAVVGLTDTLLLRRCGSPGRVARIDVPCVVP
jgi:hypothetical protein